jgi:hypothetical protein
MKRLLLALCIFFCSRTTAIARDCTVAQGDAQRVIDVATTSGSGIITSASNPWVVGDVGKVIFVTNSSSTIIIQTVVAAYTSAGQITTAATASASTSGSYAVWASVDSTSAIASAVTACRSSAATDYPLSDKYIGGEAGNVLVNGNHIVSGCIYQVETTGAIPSFFGSGRYNTVLFMAPTNTPCSAGPQLIVARGSGMQFGGFTIDGGDYLRNTSAGLMSIYSSFEADVFSVSILRWGTNNTASRALAVTGTADLAIDRVKVQNSPPNSRAMACEIGGNGVVNKILCSNHWRNLKVVSQSSRTPGSQGLTWLGGTVDECGDIMHWCTEIEDDSEMQVTGMTFFSTVRVGMGALLSITNGNVGFYNSGVRGIALQIASTGRVISSATTWRANAGGKAVVNGGTFIEGDGTEYKNCIGFICTTISRAKAFQGNQPIIP